MATEQTITVWLQQVKAGDDSAAEHLWREFFGRLVGLARRKLDQRHRCVQDEEDVALSVFDSFCRAAREGHYAGLNDRDALWNLLLLKTSRKAVDLARYNDRQKRRHPAAATTGVVENVADSAPGPEYPTLVADELQRLLERLGDGDLRYIALLKLEGHSTRDIARKLGRTTRTVQRRLEIIRRTWESGEADGNV